MTGWWILSYNWSFDILGIVNFRPWRLLMMVYALPGMIAFIWVIFLPESPRFLMILVRSNKFFPKHPQWWVHTFHINSKTITFLILGGNLLKKLSNQKQLSREETKKHSASSRKFMRKTRVLVEQSLFVINVYSQNTMSNIKIWKC